MPFWQSASTCGKIVTALLDLDPALLRCQPPPQSQAIEFAFTYAKTHLPALTRISPLPDDLPHAAGTGDLAGVNRWFDESGAPALGDLDKHSCAISSSCQTRTSRCSSLIDRGIDMTIKDYRWDATALGWARVAAKDEKMALWLEDAERQQEQGR